MGCLLADVVLAFLPVPAPVLGLLVVAAFILSIIGVIQPPRVLAIITLAVSVLPIVLGLIMNSGR